MDAARQSPVNGMDETGWKVGGRLQWLHVAVNAQVTVYAILRGRGYAQSATILGADYDGFLVHDGWAPYYLSRWLSIKVVWPTCSSGVGRAQIDCRRRQVFPWRSGVCCRRVWSCGIAISGARSPRRLAQCHRASGGQVGAECWRNRIDIHPTGDGPRHLEHERS